MVPQKPCKISVFRSSPGHHPFKPIRINELGWSAARLPMRTFAMAVDHTIFKIRLNNAGQPDFDHVAPNNRTDHWYLDETGKLAVVREVTYARVFVKRDGKWRPAVGASSSLPMSK